MATSASLFSNQGTADLILRYQFILRACEKMISIQLWREQHIHSSSMGGSLQDNASLNGRHKTIDNSECVTGDVTQKERYGACKAR